VGAYLKGMFGEAGKIDAATSRLEDIGKRAFKEAFEGEAGKRLASRQDVDNVLSEVRNVTRETESIKAQISGDAWLRQTAWVQKREAYVALLKSLDAWNEAINELSYALAHIEDSQAGSTSERYGSLRLEVEKKRGSVSDSTIQIWQRLGEVELFDSTIFNQISASGVMKGCATVVIGNPKSEDAVNAAKKVMDYRRSLISHMRKELGIPEQVPSVSP